MSRNEVKKELTTVHINKCKHKIEAIESVLRDLESSERQLRRVQSYKASLLSGSWVVFEMGADRLSVDMRLPGVRDAVAVILDAQIKVWEEKQEQLAPSIHAFVERM